MTHKFERFTWHEEAANTLTHGLGALASAAAGVVLVTLAVMGGDTWQLVSATVYSISLLLLYTASTLYHGARHKPIKLRLEIIDHCAIYILIAGTYTPFTLVTLRGVWGWSLFGVIWSLALIGVLLKLIVGPRFKLLSTLVYIGMGWLVVVAAVPMIQALPLSTLLWLLVGGLSYTGGTFFYLNRRIPYTHAIWHLFVLAGSACHYVAVCSQLVNIG